VKHFLVKLIPPRSTFPQDMSEEEKKLMQQHAAYWQGLLGEGKVIVYGPVSDPKGAYGMGVLRVENEEEARSLMAGDPTCKAGLNTVEIYPMTAVTKQK